jgi:membrane-associated phospholipid phosphatase
MAPPRFDVWLITQLARLLGRHPVLDLLVQRGIEHHVLGGLWYAAALFLLWTMGARSGEPHTRRRILTILLGSTLAGALTLLAAAVICWPPPANYPPLAHFYPDYLDPNPNTNCFPSQSTAVYAAVAAGIYSLRKRLGALLWLGIALLVALPRMYVGGHYLSDVLVGLLLGLAGYGFAAAVLEDRLVPALEKAADRLGWFRVLGEFVVFLWILEVAVEFDDVLWVKHGVVLVLGHFFGQHV